MGLARPKTMPGWISAAFLLLAPVLVAGCAPTHLYPGPTRDPSSVAHLSTLSGGCPLSKSFAFDVAVTQRGDEENLAEAQCRL